MSTTELRLEPRFTPFQADLLRVLERELTRGKVFSLAGQVGSGKSFAVAGAIAELLRIGHVRRALVLTMAALIPQWQVLAEKFGHTVTVLDARALRQLQQDLAVNDPWPGDWYVASIDFSKQDHARMALVEQPWDFIVVDEAQGLSGQRAALVDALIDAPGRPAVLYASATPPMERVRAPGVTIVDWRAAVAEFLAAKAPAAPVTREVVAYQRTAAEQAVSTMIEQVARGLGQPRGPQLVARAASSIAALHSTLLQVASDGDSSVEDALDALDALDDDSKLDALLGLLDRLSQGAQSVVVFTRFRDTLDYLVAAIEERQARCLALHGGLAAARKRQVVEELRTTGGVLVATDAGTAGASLSFVRSAVHYDLPWTPQVYLQRVGRYDRFSRTEPCTAYLLEDTTHSLQVEPLVMRMIEKVDLVDTTDDWDPDLLLRGVMS